MSVRKRSWVTTKGETKEAWVVDYIDQRGDRHIETFARKKDADDYQATVKVDVRKGTHTAPSKSPTVEEAAARWLAEVDARNVERATTKQYKEHVNLHILPLIGRTRLSTITPERVEAFRDELLARLSRPLARKVLTSFKSLVKVSRYSHVAVGVAIKKEKRKRRLEPGRNFPEAAEINRLLIAASSDLKRRALLLIAAFAGLRASELRGLRWRDIDLNAAELHVRQRADRYNKIGSPKSDSSVRTIPLDNEVMVPALKKWKLKCPPSEFVFPTSTGRIEHHSNMLRGLAPIMLEAGITMPAKNDRGEQTGGEAGRSVLQPKYALHAFRHFFASWCINPKLRGGRELPPKQVQYLLGHSTIAMTFDIYGHLFPSENNRDELTAAVRQLLA
jgi:integrase